MQERWRKKCFEIVFEKSTQEWRRKLFFSSSFRDLSAVRSAVRAKKKFLKQWQRYINTQG